MRKKLQKKDPHTNESGYMLITVVLIITIIAVLGVSVIGITKNAVNTSSSERSDQSAFYIAEAGMTVKMEKIKDIVDKAKSKDNPDDYFWKLNEEFRQLEGQYEDFEKVSGEADKPYADITVDEVPDGVERNNKKYRLTSIGHIGNKKRKLERVFKVSIEEKQGEGSSELGMALLAKDTIEMTGGVSITGDIGTLKKGADTIKVRGGHTVNGSVCVPAGWEDVAVNSTDKDFPQATTCTNVDFPKLPPFPLIPNYMIPSDQIVEASEWNKTKVIEDGKLMVNNWITNGYTLELEENVKLKRIHLDSDYTLNINTGDSDREIVVSDLDMTNGHIKLKGSGKLTIYVTGKLTFGSGSTINQNGDVSNLNMFLKGSGKKVKLNGSQKVFGSLYAEDADITLTAGSGFQGNIFTGGKRIKINGGTGAISKLILAPNANVEHSQGGTVRGTIATKSIKISGGGSLIYDSNIPDPGGLGGIGSGSESSGKITDMGQALEVDL